jgi:hypothetical protein
MLYRALSLSLLALAVALFLGNAVPAQENAKNTHEGTVVSATAEKLVMKDKASGKEMTHTLAPDAKVTCDGKACKLADLKEGLRVRVTTKADNERILIRVEALDKERTFSKGAGG